jgi:[acyl-carrier-protein] S-malonyltransferase
MAPAVDSLAAYASEIEVSNPSVSIWSNNAGRKVSSGKEFLDLLVNQVKSPVRWDLCMESLVAAGVTAILEVPPAGTLVGLAKRSMPGIELLSLKSPENLDAARTLIQNHSN